MKLRLLAAAVAAAAISAWAVSAGLAAPNPFFEPLTTNVPYLAWRGEELRLVKCATDETDGAATVSVMKDAVDGSRRFDVDWLVEDWSGPQFDRPQLETSTVRFFNGNGEYAGEPCVKADFVSLKAGLAQIKLVVTDARTGNPVLKHQFLAGWLGLNTPTIRELSAADQPGGGGALGDPTGDGRFFARGLPGRVQVQVTGNLPLGNNFTELGLPASINLPTEANGDTFWDDLAQRMATTSVALPFYRDAPWRMWDIHDDRATTEGHVAPGPQCNQIAAATTIDAVDACLGARLFFGDGEYSRVFGDRSLDPTFGPFDPLRPEETLLSDGKLDAGDVPMPSALVEVRIAPNSGSATDIGGVGSLAILNTQPPAGADPLIGVFKCIPYSRDHKCTSASGPHSPTVPNVAPPPFGPAAHNHYAPYYSRWQPATTATVDGSLDENASLVREASGNDGPGVGNNFPGYRGSGLYDYWQFVDVLSTAAGGPTRCPRIFNQQTPVFRQRPSGPQAVLLFSDEHGEAQAYFNPGTGFFFDNLVTPNGNGGCDLRGIDILGVADISAVARYPYQKVTDPDKPSGTIRKVVRSLFSKEVSCVLKSGLTGPEAGTAFICTATAIDIDGTPFANERVCFTAGGTGAERIFAFPIGSPGELLGSFTLCLRTNSAGQAQVEVLGKCGTGNVFALFEDERILRVSNVFTFGCPPGGGGTTTTTTTTTTAAPAGAQSAPTGVLSAPAAPAAVIQQIVQQATGTQGAQQRTAQPAAKAPKAKLAVVRVEKKAFAKQTARYVVVRVNGKAKTARIRVTLVARNGKVLSRVTRVVPTNRLVRVPNLKLPKAAVNARVSVLG